MAKVKPIADVKQIQALTHNAVLWCDHEGGKILSKGSHPFSSYLEMENKFKETKGYFRFQTSPYSNGNLEAKVWYNGKLVLSIADSPGPVYRYPSSKLIVSTYKPGSWEDFLLSKNYHKDTRYVR